MAENGPQKHEDHVIILSPRLVRIKLTDGGMGALKEQLATPSQLTEFLATVANYSTAMWQAMQGSSQLTDMLATLLLAAVASSLVS